MQAIRLIISVMEGSIIERHYNITKCSQARNAREETNAKHFCGTVLRNTTEKVFTLERICGLLLQTISEKGDFETEMLNTASTHF